MARVDLAARSTTAMGSSTTLPSEFHQSYAACTGLDLSREENSADFHIAPEEDLLQVCDIPVFMHYIRILIASPCPRVTYILLRHL